MMELLFFIIGIFIGSAVCCVFMAGFQLHRINKYEYQIMKLRHQLDKERTEKGGICNDRKRVSVLDSQNSEQF